MDWLAENWKLFADIAAYLIAAASIIVKLTPTPKDDAWLAIIVKLLGRVSLHKDELTKDSDGN